MGTAAQRRQNVTPCRCCHPPLLPLLQVVYYLSGLTCTDENFVQKAGAQRKAAELGLAVVAPDTSPRGLGIEGEDERCGARGIALHGDQAHGCWKRHPCTHSCCVAPPALRHACSWDFGTGAGFYLDATADKWRQYRMYSYITQELPALLRSMPELDVDNVSGG